MLPECMFIQSHPSIQHFPMAFPINIYLLRFYSHKMNINKSCSYKTHFPYVYIYIYIYTKICIYIYIHILWIMKPAESIPNLQTPHRSRPSRQKHMKKDAPTVQMVRMQHSVMDFTEGRWSSFRWYLPLCFDAIHMRPCNAAISVQFGLLWIWAAETAAPKNKNLWDARNTAGSSHFFWVQLKTLREWLT